MDEFLELVTQVVDVIDINVFYNSQGVDVTCSGGVININLLPNSQGADVTCREGGQASLDFIHQHWSRGGGKREVRKRAFARNTER